jgi:hypothetical protein
MGEQLTSRDLRVMEISDDLIGRAAPGDDGGHCYQQVADVAAARIAELESELALARTRFEHAKGEGRFDVRASIGDELYEAGRNAGRAEIEAERRWIPVGEDWPAAGVAVLVVESGSTQPAWGYWDADWYVLGPRGYTNAGKVTHWMPLPKPPEVSDAE